MQHIWEQLEKSFSDEILSRGEKRDLKEIIGEENLTKQDADWLRSKIFELAENSISGNDNLKVLNWLENVNKLLLPKSKALETSKVYSSPSDDCLDAINSQIEKAVSSIQICVFTISDNRIAKKILDAHNRGVSVKIITDDDKCNDKGSDIYTLYEEGLNVKIDRSPNHMHNKFAVFDKKTALTGSYNWTRSAADRNQENILVTSEPSVVAAYLKLFDNLWHQMFEV